MSNATKFTSHGSVELSLVVAGDEAEISVADTGPGIPADMLAQMFEPFAQGDATTSRAHGGAGLGLALSRRLARLMGGELSGANRPHGGAVFRLMLPLARAKDVPAVASPATAPPSSGRAPRILVVDDHPTNREVARVMLEALGCEVEVAHDGLESLAAARTATFDMILMDVRMPRMDGLEATSEIRALPGAAAATPIVAMTADAMPEDVARCLAAGMNAHLAKPVSSDGLCAVLERFVGEAAAEPGQEGRAVA